MNQTNCPPNCIGIVMSNFDGNIEEAIGKRLMNDPDTNAEYSAWEFHGTVWYDREEKEFVCEVRRHHILIAHVCSPTLEGIMAHCREHYGAD